MTRNSLIPIALAALSIPALSGAAAARHPDHYEMKKVKHLAHEIYEGAHYLYEKSSSYAGHHGRYEKKALYALHELSKEAHEFYRAADRHYRDPYRTERAFKDLVYAWYEAKDSFRYLPTYKHYHDDFYCLVDYMDDLVHYYGGYSAYDRHHRSGYGRPGHYGYDRHDDGYGKSGYGRDGYGRDGYGRDGYGRDGYSKAETAARIVYRLHHILDDDD